MSTSPIADARPLIVACLRITDLRPVVDPLTGAVSRDVWGVGLSAADAAALEHALRAAEAWSGRVLAVAVGPAAIEPVLRDVMALGASVLRVPNDAEDTEHGYALELGGGEQALARTIAASLARFGPPTLVLCGDRSVDRGTGALPAFLAHELGAAQALGLVGLEVDPSSGGRHPLDELPAALLGERRLDGGWRERLRVPLPAVCSVEGAGTRLRRAALEGALSAGAAPVPVEPPTPSVDQPTPLAGPGSEDGPRSTHIGALRPFEPRTRVLPPPASEDPRIRLLALTGALVAHDPPTLIGPLGAVESADELLRFLVRHGYLDQPAVPDPTGTEACR
ncbi:MAG TPA: mycofactocin-associated electron transfer flavoprotein beta subunit [Acidimicrobiales bacterium]|jgi:electron transfer flavoprotein beta subunit|nr:mycofactocin-associated electron transfer flavoprotein beta subunit [Acidimicrobiales bacterium]